MEYWQYLEAAAKEQAAHPSYRNGQALFNVLYDVRPDLAEQVRGTHLDPFYDNGLVGEFLDFVAANWEE